MRNPVGNELRAPTAYYATSWRYRDTITGQLVNMVDQLDAAALRSFLMTLRAASQPEVVMAEAAQIK